MKIKLGFVSNSSSSSFIINKSALSDDQIEAIKYHGEYSAEHDFGQEYCDCPWDVNEDESTISGYTYIDNFDMKEFLNKLGVNSLDVKWSD